MRIYTHTYTYTYKHTSLWFMNENQRKKMFFLLLWTWTVEHLVLAAAVVVVRLISLMHFFLVFLSLYSLALSFHRTYFILLIPSICRWIYARLVVNVSHIYLNRKMRFTSMQIFRGAKIHYLHLNSEPMKEDVMHCIHAIIGKFANNEKYSARNSKNKNTKKLIVEMDCVPFGCCWLVDGGEGEMNEWMKWVDCVCARVLICCCVCVFDVFRFGECIREPSKHHNNEKKIIKREDIV